MRKHIDFPEKKNLNSYQYRMRRKPTKSEQQFKNTVLIPLKKRYHIGFVAQKMLLETKSETDYKGYIFDFCLPSLKLCIEIDGKTHNGLKAKTYDAIKASYAAKKGFRVIRFTNDETKNPDKCFKRLYQEIEGWKERKNQFKKKEPKSGFVSREEELKLQDEFIKLKGLTKCPLVGRKRKTLNH